MRVLAEAKMGDISRVERIFKRMEQASVEVRFRRFPSGRVIGVESMVEAENTEVGDQHHWIMRILN